DSAMLISNTQRRRSDMKLLQPFFTSLFQDVLRQPTQQFNTAATRPAPHLSQTQPPPAPSYWPPVAGLAMLIPLVLSSRFVSRCGLALSHRSACRLGREQD